MPQFFYTKRSRITDTLCRLNIERDKRPVIERILRHLRLWEGPIRTLPKSCGPPKGAEQDLDKPRELQLVLDPEFL
jgi:hypothetical protein